MDRFVLDNNRAIYKGEYKLDLEYNNIFKLLCEFNIICDILSRYNSILLKEKNNNVAIINRGTYDYMHNYKNDDRVLEAIIDEKHIEDFIKIILDMDYEDKMATVIKYSYTK